MEKGTPHQYKLVRVRKTRKHHIHWAGVIGAVLVAAFGAVLYTCAMMENMPRKGPGAF